MSVDEAKTQHRHEKMLGILSERIACVEKIQRLQHAELTKLFAGIRALQGAFDALTTAASAPKN